MQMVLTKPRLLVQPNAGTIKRFKRAVVVRSDVLIHVLNEWLFQLLRKLVPPGFAWVTRKQLFAAT